MIGAFAIASLAGGTFAACVPYRLNMSAERGELLGGVLLVLGCALIGVGLTPILS